MEAFSSLAVSPLSRFSKSLNLCLGLQPASLCPIGARSFSRKTSTYSFSYASDKLCEQTHTWKASEKLQDSAILAAGLTPEAVGEISGIKKVEETSGVEKDKYTQSPLNVGPYQFSPQAANLTDNMEDALPTEVSEEVQSLSEMYEEEYDVLNKIYSGDMADAESAPKYMPKKTMDDPIVKALAEKLGVGEVIKIELLESRWNGNDCYKYVTDKGPFFVKVNRVEDVSVFTAEALGLVTIARTNSTRVPRPYHVGPLPRVGEFGPGAFLVMEYMTLKPFGSQISTNQTALGQQLAAMHLSTELANVHQGRFGFVVNNWLAISPQNNTWTSSWQDFFHRRLHQQIQRAYQVRDFSETGVAPTTDPELQEKGRRLLELVPRILADVEVTPSLVHGDLWIGNTGADQHGPVLFDPAVYFGHHEVELGICDMYGGYSQRFYDAYHDAIPRADGFDTRHTLYQLYHYLNILNLFGDPQVNDKCIELMTALLS